MRPYVEALAGAHRTWCGLWSDDPTCSCGEVTVEGLVEYFAAAARERLVERVVSRRAAAA